MCIDVEANACGSSFQGFGLGECICQNCYVIGVFSVNNCFCGVPSASFLCQLETVLFDFIDRCSKHVVYTDDNEVWGKCVSLQYPSYNVEVVCVSIRRTHFHFGVSIENHYGCYGFFGRLYATKICSIFPLCMESKAFVKSTNNIVAYSCFAHVPSRILRIVKICEVEVLFLLKPFWFFLRMLSNLGSMRLRSRALYILAAIDVSVLPR